MNHGWRLFSPLLMVVFLCLLLCACTSDTPWRYDPGAPDRPFGLAATADNGQVSLSWPTAGNAAAYRIYVSTTPDGAAANKTRIATVTGTSYTQTGLTNGTTYYFVITSVNSNSESAESNQVSATPALLGSYVQGDVEGTWNFNALVSGAGAGWMRGTLAVDNAGAVTFSSFLDSSGRVRPPADLFPALFVNSAGQVRDTSAVIPAFQGVMAANRKMIVGNSSPDGTSQSLVILQKQVPGITFSNAGDLQGFGNTGGGGRRFVYHQLSSGFNQEWEAAAGQIGRDLSIKYTSVNAPSNHALPGDKASMVNISTDGIVTESRTTVLPQPAAVIDKGIMSADKSVIIGTATDSSGASPRYILRIYQLITMIANDSNSFTAADLAGTYDLLTLTGGTSTLSSNGDITINAFGSVAFSSYTDSSGAGNLPPDFTLAADASGNLTNAADASLLGKFSYFKEMFVMTKTDSSGACSLSIALKRQF
ncbi:MAG: fibronectin type III domain-containing protein [Pelobacteraceae bacterium]